MGRRLPVALAAILSSLLLMPRLGVVSEKAIEKPRIYADPEGRFSFQLSGDWIKLRGDADKGIAGSFLLTRDVGGNRKVVAELLISFAEVEAPAFLEEYVKAEDRRAMNTEGFARIGDPERRVLGGCAALRNRYSFSRRGGPEELRHKVLYQYYALKDKRVWGITLAALREDESVLAQVEGTVVSSFQFSVPEGSREGPPDAFKEVAVGGRRGGFSLAVPDDWEVRQNEEEGASIRGPEAVVYAFAVPAEGEQQSPEDMAGKFLKERENLEGLRVLSQGVGELGLVEGYAVEYSGTAKGQNWHARLITFVGAEKVFFVCFVAPEQRWQRNSEILRRIERSFSVGTPAAKIHEEN
ncbi:hypothetical protein HQ563_16445 [bacterium]|nr:hypothetical protein [bacterium]